jgi:uncharacterized membrane protein (DUF4010 family)
MEMHAPVFNVAESFAVALLMGALVGVEREKKKEASPRPGFAGIRTFMLLSETGALSAWLSIQVTMPWLFCVAFAGLIALTGIAYVMERRELSSSPGLTTELAAITVFLLGAAVMFGYAEIAVGLAVVNTALLAFKAPLHGAIQKLGWEDIYAAIKLLIATFIVLPLLPHQAIDPWGALVPYKLWLLVVLISALSLVGYVAIRCLGSTRGIVLTGLMGGLVSSTAVTYSMAREAGQNRPSAQDSAYVSGILCAWIVMFVRVLAIILALYPPLFQKMLWPFLMMLGVNVVFAVWHVIPGLRSASQGGATTGDALHNPFSLWSAARFGALFAIVLLLVEVSRRYLSDSGLIYVSVLAGTTDVDAITLAMSGQAAHPGQLVIAAQSVIACIVSNTLAKTGLAAVIGGQGLARKIACAGVAIAFAGGLAAIYI